MKISIMRQQAGKIRINKAKVITEGKIKEAQRTLLKMNERVFCKKSPFIKNKN